MKKIIYYLCLLFCIACQKDIIENTTVLNVDFDFYENEGVGIFINRCNQNADTYELKIYGDLVKKGSMKDTLAEYKFPAKGDYLVQLSVSNRDGFEKMLEKTLSIKGASYSIDSSLLIKPEIKISYEILDSGYVQFHLLSPDNGDWYTIFGTIDYTTDPKIWFRNGLNEIGFGTRSKYNVYADTSIYINITNSIPQIDSKRFVKGVVFGDSIDISYEVDIQNTFKGWPLLPYDSLTPVATVWPNIEDPYIILADLNTTRGTDISKIRNLLKVGPVAMANYNTGILDNGNIYLKDRTTDGWNLFVSHKSKNRYEIAFTSTGKKESLEILDVREIYQAPIFPGLEPTAFIATFHYKGLLWGQSTQTSSVVYQKIPGRDKIDLIFDVKFNVYPKWVH